MLTQEVVVMFVHGVVSFALGLAVFLELRQDSTLHLQRHLKWLAAFGISDGILMWSDMFLHACRPADPFCNELLTIRTVLLPLPGLMLIIFGAGLISELSHHQLDSPKWLTFAPAVILTPAALLIAYVITSIITAPTVPEMHLTTELWTRYLLYFPGCLAAGFGFLFQRYEVDQSASLKKPFELMHGAAVAFFFMAFTSSVLVPPASNIWAPLLNNSIAQILTVIPFNVWGVLSAIALTYFVIRALNVFQEEHQQAIEELNLQREEAQRLAFAAQVEARHHAENWTEGLVGIGRHIANMDNTDDVLSGIVSLGRRLLGADTAALAAWDDDGTHLKIKCHISKNGNGFVPEEVVCNPLILECARQAKALRYPDDADSTPWHCAVVNHDVHAAVVVALQLDSRPLGVIWLERVEPDLFTEEDVLGLSHLADQAVIAIEHALMAARIQSVATTEERSRIAREMHDGLAQILGYLSLELQTLEALTKQDNKDEVLKELRQARQRITMAQADVRESILSLRTTLAGNTGIISALQQYCEEFEIQTGVNVQFVDATRDAVNLSSIAEVQLICIIREAFTNIRKHARATQIQLELAYTTNWLTATIADNGCGFAEHTLPGHFGLQTMRERAQSVGGELKIESCPAQGTLVKLRLPLIA